MNLFGIEFTYPIAFVLLVFLPVVFFIEFRNLRYGLKAVMPAGSGFHRIPSFGFFIRLGLKSLIFVLFVLMLANPGYTHTQAEETRKGIDIVLLMDISNSMLAEDMKPNRIEAAKMVIGDFISKTVSDRLGFILFAGKPFVSVPLTFEYQYISDYVKSISTRSINQGGEYVDFDGVLKNLSGTSIGDALIMGADSLESTGSTDPKREKVLILITDGAAETGINPKVAVKYVKQRGIKIYSIGIGKTEGVPLCITNPLGQQDCLYDLETGKPRIVKVDEEMLRYLSSTTGGKYYNAQSNDALKEIFDDLSGLNKSEIKVKVIKSFIPGYLPFLIAIALSMAALGFLEYNNRLQIKDGIH